MITRMAWMAHSLAYSIIFLCRQRVLQTLMQSYSLYRAWSGNKNAQDTIRRTMNVHPNGKLKVTLPNDVVDSSILDKALKQN